MGSRKKNVPESALLIVLIVIFSSAGVLSGSATSAKSQTIAPPSATISDLPVAVGGSLVPVKVITTVVTLGAQVPSVTQ